MNNIIEKGFLDEICKIADLDKSRIEVKTPKPKPVKPMERMRGYEYWLRNVTRPDRPQQQKKYPKDLARAQHEYIFK